jgi:hypothetical protein
VWMGAGPVPGILHRALNALAWTVRLKILPSLSPFAGLMHRVINIVRWGEHRGGMFVAVRGAGPKGEIIARSWHLVAEGDDGPYIPSMAVQAVIRSKLAGRTPPAGARSAIGDLSLSDYASSFAQRRIYTGSRQESPVAPDVPLYRRLLGEAWILLPEPLQRMHESQLNQVAEGRAKVERGSGLCARVVAWLFGFPKTGENVPLRVTFQPRKGEETWRRDFAGSSFASLQRVGTGRLEGLLDESFGPFVFGLALVVDGQILRLVPRRWSFLGIPLPAVLIPHGDAYEFASNGRFNFHVEIRLPLVGMIVRYQGWLVPVAETAYEAPVAKSGVILETR